MVGVAACVPLLPAFWRYRRVESLSSPERIWEFVRENFIHESGRIADHLQLVRLFSR